MCSIISFTIAVFFIILALVTGVQFWLWVGIFVGAIGIGLWQYYQTEKHLKKEEAENIIPILKELYHFPNSKSKHQEFRRNLSNLCQAAQGDQTKYIPSDDVNRLIIQHLDVNPNDDLGNERYKMLINLSGKINRNYMLNLLFQQLENHFDNPLVHERLAIALENSILINQKFLEPLLHYWSHNPNNPLIQQSFFLGVSNIILLSNEQRSLVYNLVLSNLEEFPNNISAKKLALTMGRWVYSKARPDGKLTIYDEQAIQNDINIRSY
jgi:hypothetical protein